jgi:hypothetical protein
VLRTSENLGNHSIGPIFFCSVDHYRQNVWKDYCSRHETYVFGGKRSGAALIDTWPTCSQKKGALNRKSINGDSSAIEAAQFFCCSAGESYRKIVNQTHSKGYRKLQDGSCRFRCYAKAAKQVTSRVRVKRIPSVRAQD